MNKLNSRILGILLCSAFSSQESLANPLHDLVKNQDLFALCDYIELKLPSFAELMHPDENGINVIEMALETENAQMIQILTEIARFLQTQERAGTGIGLAGPLHTLARRGDLAGVHLYLAYNRVTHRELMTVDWNDENPLEIARNACNWKLLALLTASADYLLRTERAALRNTLIEDSEDSISAENTPRWTELPHENEPRHEEHRANQAFFVFDEEYLVPNFFTPSRLN